MVVLRKGIGSTKKKKIKNKIETDIPSRKFFGGAHEFSFINIKTILQKYITNKSYK
jgi:hypothetical protein